MIAALQRKFFEVAEQRSALWFIREDKPKGQIVDRNDTELDITKSWELLETAITDKKSLGITGKFKVEVRKNQYDGKGTPIHFVIEEKTAGIGNLGKGSSNDYLMFSIQQQQEIANERLKSYQKETQLRRQIEEANSQRAKNLSEQVIELMENPTIQTITEKLIKGIGTFAPLLMRRGVSIGTLENEAETTETETETQQKTVKMSRKEKLNYAIETLEDFTNDPEQLLVELANFVKSDPEKAKLGLSMIGIKLEK